MHRLACINIPQFPLQLLLQKHPSWRNSPVAVVEEDKTQRRLRLVNKIAKKQGIVPGQNHSSALALCNQLKSSIVCQEEERKALTQIVKLLRNFSPEVEACPHQSGVFWCNVSGLGKIYKNLQRWGSEIVKALRQESVIMPISLVVGFRKFGVYALAKSNLPGIQVISDIRQEEQASLSVRLEALEIPSHLHTQLQALGIITLGNFISLPASAVADRFGNEAYRLHSLASNTSWDPLRPERIKEKADAHIILDEPERNLTRLLFSLRRSIDSMLTLLAKRSRAAIALYVYLKYDHSKKRKLEVIRPATSTLESKLLLSLLKLRLESETFPLAITEIYLCLEEELASCEQLELFSRKPKRCLRSANEVLARLRAELGNDAILVARLQDGHLPESRFILSPMQELKLAAPHSKVRRTLIRRLFKRPRMLSATMQYDPQYVHLNGIHTPNIEIQHTVGPHIITGGWWNREIARHYYYLASQQGDLLWAYYDLKRRQWFLQGRVE